MQEPIPQPSHEEIAAAAYLIWEKNGRPHGRDVEFWHQAQESLKASPPPPPAAPVPSDVNLRRNGPVFDTLPGKRGKKSSAKAPRV